MPTEDTASIAASSNPGPTDRIRPPRLKSLRAPPTDEKDLDAFCNDIAEESDKGVAMLVSAHLDSELESELIRFMEVGDELDLDERHQLFGESGPLTSLGAKARLGHAMGLHGRVTRDDIILISKIRNAFAHSPQSLTFDNPLIYENCRHLKALSAYEEAGIISVVRGSEMYGGTARLMFTFTAALIPLAITAYYVANMERRTAQSNMLLAHIRRSGQSDTLIRSDEIAAWVRTKDPKMPP
jgi:hypothetical protein